MKKRGLLVLLVSAVILSAALPTGMCAFGEESYEDSGEWMESTEEETEDPIPESYYLPIESNEIEGWPTGPQIEAEAAVVMDADTGAFLYSKNMTAKEYPASITKIMTALLAIENGDLDETITFSEIVYDIEYASSHAGIQPGEEMTLRQALYALMLESANDAANGIAEHIAGSVSNFVDMMNEKAAELGCVNTHFENPHGLHDENHYTCARDMALIAQAAFQNKEFRKIVGTIEYSIPETNKVDETRYFLNHQKMLYQEDVYYEPCLGGKTGFTEDAWNTLVTFAKKDKRTLISVILRVNGSTKSFLESAEILDYGYDNFKRARIKIPEYSETIGELAGILELSEAAVTYDSQLSQKAVKKKSSVVLDIPSNLSASDITKTISNDGKIHFTYEGWELGSTDMSFNSLDLEISQPELSQETYQTMQEQKETEEYIPEDETAQEKALRIGRKYLKKAQEWALSAWEKIQEWAGIAWDFILEKLGFLDGWVTENELKAALLTLILILILIPVLIVAWRRNSKAKKIRKARKLEKEDRVRIEKDIDTKSVSEIEQELRMELEREMEQRRKEEEKKAEAKREEEEMQAAERIIEEREALKEAEEAVVVSEDEKEELE
ncbi:MAG: D-alanyl-D-alanine carboxypeptidase family protein [Eubacteriales bacterium]|nr:D-alanyl-D-alanine carboxypeptidase family protein [Eubacteriales bacterium]